MLRPLLDWVKWMVLVAVLVFVAIIIFPGRCCAIPAFARKYRMSCTTCHAPPPRLKPYGDDFAGNAFRLNDEEEPKRYFIETGDEYLNLLRELPLAMRFDAYMKYSYNEEMDMMDLGLPYGLKLMSGGNISKNIGYYLYFYMSEMGEVAGIEDAYIHFNNLFGIDLDLMVGQFQVSDPLFKRELRLTHEDYQIYKVKIGAAPTNLAYDRGFMLTYGHPIGLDAVFEIVNGNGKDEAISGVFDSDDWKNVLIRLSQGIGFFRAGGFGYFCNSIQWSGDETVENEHWYWGVDCTVDLADRLQINAQYLERKDDNPFFFTLDPVEIETKGGMIEAIWAVNGEDGRSFLTFLYNFVESDIAYLDYHTETLSYSHLVRRNVRLLGEITYDEELEEARLVCGLISAF